MAHARQHCNAPMQHTESARNERQNEILQPNAQKGGKDVQRHLRHRLYWNLKNGTEMLYGIPVRVLSVASWFHWSGMLLVSYYDNSGCKSAAGRQSCQGRRTLLNNKAQNTVLN